MASYLKRAEPRPKEDLSAVRDIVRDILESVQAEGEAAVRRYSLKFDRWAPDNFKISPDEINAARQIACKEPFQQDKLFHRYWKTMPSISTMGATGVLSQPSLSRCYKGGPIGEDSATIKTCVQLCSICNSIIIEISDDMIRISNGSRRCKLFRFVAWS